MRIAASTLFQVSHSRLRTCEGNGAGFVRMAESNERISAQRKRSMIILLFACNLLASFMQSLLNVALDYVSEQYHVSLSEANLLVLGYSIVAGIVIVLAATSLRRFGLRKIMLFGLVVSFAGSLLGVVAWDFASLLVARLIQAVATGLYFPVVNEALLNLSPKNGAGRLLALDSGIIGMGLAAAPIISGLVITYWGLRVLFAIPTIMAFIVFFFAWRFFEDIMPRQKLAIDIPSIILMALGLATFMVGLNEVTRYPLPMAALMVVGVLLCALFIRRQGHLKQPLLDMRPLRNRTYVMGELLIVLSYMSSIYLSLLIPLYLEGVSGYAPFIAGCLIAPATLCYAGLCLVSGRILSKSGPWPLVPIGFAICLIGFVGLAVFTRIDIAIAVVCSMGVACAGIGAEYPAIKSVDLEVLPADLSTSGSSIHSTLVQVAGSISSALFVGLMSGQVHRLMAEGASKARAYDGGFSFTVYLAIAFVIAAAILSVIYSRRAAKLSEHKPN